MQKLVLLSVILASIVIPARAARMKNARAGLRKTLVNMAIFALMYALLAMFPM